jgi:hypothetical protein
MWNSDLLRDKRLWAAVGAAVLLITLLTFWAIRSHQRAEMRDALNAFAPFHSPPIELQFPRFVLEDDTSRRELFVGAREGIWKLHPVGGQRPAWEVRLTDQGMRWFSIVGNRVVGTFTAGTRQVTRVIALDDTFPSRHVRFRFVWTRLHPGVVALGSLKPVMGTEYQGEATLYHEGEEWRILHWTAYEFDRAVAQFNALPSP